MTSTEFAALKDCGYESQNDPIYGQLFKPNMSQDFVTKRKNYTLVDMRMANEMMRVSQAIQNLSGELTLAHSLMGFLKPADYSQSDRDTHKKYIAGLQINGVPMTNLENWRIRKTDLAIVAATEKLAADQVPESLKQSMLQAISGAVRHTAKPYFDRLGLDEQCRDLLLLAMDKQIAKDVDDRKFDMNFRLSSFCRVEA